MLNKVLFALSIALCLIMITETGIAGSGKDRKSRRGLAEFMHTVKPFGRKLCMTEHMHYGVSDWNTNKKTSHEEAVNSWEVFTKFEYRSRWSSFKMARERKVLCKQNAYRQWRCEAEGRPCRLRKSAR